MKTVELITHLEIKHLQHPVYFRIGVVSYPVQGVEIASIAGQEAVVLTWKETDAKTNLPHSNPRTD